jgi:ribosomal protein S18 acetylase RimI-like enzyme
MIKDITIRLARPDEAPEITRFHVKIWRETYADLAPQEAVTKLDEKHRLPTWEKYLSSPKPQQKTYVAVQDAQIVGLISFGPPTDAVFGDFGEIKHLYVDKSCARMGIGKRLMQKACGCLEQSGFKGAALAVLQENEAAFGFYQSIGGKQTGNFIDAGPIWKSDNAVFSWSFT